MRRALADRGRSSGSGKISGTSIRASILGLFRSHETVTVREAIEELRQFNAQQIRASLCGLAKDGILQGSGDAWLGNKRYRLTNKGYELTRRAPVFTAQRFAELCLAFFGRGMRTL